MGFDQQAAVHFRVKLLFKFDYFSQCDLNKLVILLTGLC